MARPKNTYPKPFIRQRGKSWQVRWTYDDEEYAMSVSAASKEEARVLCAVVAIALAGKDDWPLELAGMPAVKRYLARRAGQDVHEDDKKLIDQYAGHLQKNSRSAWNRTVKYHLTAASDFTGNLLHAKTPILTDFLDTINDTKSTATRNRALASLSGFFRWLRLRQIFPKGYNPLFGIKILHEEHTPEGIVIWESKEVKALLAAADHRRDGIAVWVAVLAGLRRGEIARLRWSDIADTCILVQKSKTGSKRQVPLSKALAARLGKIKTRNGLVVPWPENFHGWGIAARRLTKEYLPKLLPKIYEKHPEKFGWNPFRHTFASRLAQKGLSLDIIAAWLGDSPKVCKEHYARYVSKNMRDKRIDLVDPDF